MARNNYKDESWVGWKNDYGVEVIEIIGTENGHTRWYCKCPLNGVDCKGIWPTDAERVAKNKTKSCGCFQATYSLGKYIGYTNDYGSEVIEIMEHRNKHGAVIWRCLCKCGKTFPTTARSFMSGHTKSCGCKKESYEKEKWVGWKIKFGVEVVGISKERTKTDRKSIQWDCICPICGNIFSSPAMNIRFNHTKSCGCLKEKYSSEKYIGRKYGDIGGGIEVIGIGGKDERGNVIWHCKCFCGVEFSE